MKPQRRGRAKAIGRVKVNLDETTRRKLEELEKASGPSPVQTIIRLVKLHNAIHEHFVKKDGEKQQPVRLVLEGGVVLENDAARALGLFQARLEGFAEAERLASARGRLNEELFAIAERRLMAMNERSALSPRQQKSLLKRVYDAVELKLEFGPFKLDPKKLIDD